MGIAYFLDEKLGATFVQWEDAITSDVFLAHVHRLVSDPAWPPGPLHLTDLRFASLNPSVDEATLEEAARLYGQDWNKVARLKVAVVAEDAFPRARIFERYLSRYGATVIVFATMTTACIWLGIPGDQADTVFKELHAQAAGHAA